MFGKTMANLRNRINVKLVNIEKDYLKYTSKPSYTSHKIFDNNLVSIRKSQIALKLYKLTYFEMCILDLSKILTYEFHDDYIKRQIWKPIKTIIYRY